jgi:hypothetical protein
MAGVKLGDAYDLEDLALETGSSIDYADGSKFNSAGEVAKRRAPKAVAMPEAEDDENETPEPPNPEMMALLKQLVTVVSRPVEVKFPPIPAPQVTVQATEQKVVAPKAWTFEFERNSNGTIKRINAKSTEI